MKKTVRRSDGQTVRQSVHAWFLLFRPWSYTATLIPFMTGAALAAQGGAAALDWTRWGTGFVAGLLFQATVNLLNTWGDERSGVDDVAGAIRTTPQVHEGLVSMRALLAVALACTAGAGLIGAALCFRRAADGWTLNVPLFVAGFVGFLGSTNYSTGIRFKYRGLGVPFVSFLMGPLETFVAVALLVPSDVAVGLVGRVAWMTFPMAALVGVIMHGNDMRDIPTDRAAGIVTFASWMGPRRALGYYRFCHALPYVFALGAGSPWFLLTLLALPLTVKTLLTAAQAYRSNPASPPWRGLERGSGGIHCLFGLLYALACFLAR